MLRAGKLRGLLGLAILVVAGCGGGTPGETSAAPLWGDAPGAALELRLQVEPREVQLFGEVECVLDLFVEGVGASSESDAGEGEEAVEFSPAVPEEMSGSFEATRRVLSAGGRRGLWLRHRAILRPVALDAVTIGPFSYTRADGETVTTPEIRVEVTPALGEDDAKADVEAPAPLFAEPAPLWPWLAGGGGLLALCVLCWLWRRAAARRAARSDPAGIALPPHVRALRALGRLRSAPRTTAAEVEAFYVEVSQILRVYLEERFGLRAPERTTEEFLPELERSGVLDATQRVHLRQFLEQCDLVKFAAVRPEEDVHDATFEFAEDLVESTRPERSAEAMAS